MTDESGLDAPTRRIAHAQALLDSVADTLGDRDPNRAALMRAYGLLEQAGEDLAQAEDAGDHA